MSELEADQEWVVWKYPLSDGTTRWELDLPLNARVVLIGHQGNTPMLWIAHQPKERARQKRTFEIFGTGETVPARGVHVGSFQAMDVFGSDLVFHVFEVTVTGEHTVISDG